MAELTGATIAPGDLAEVYTRTVVDIGTRMFDDEGNEYIFLLGVASTAIGSWVTYDEVGATTLLAANAVGPVAIAMAAIVADKLGWYQIYGSAQGVATDNMDDNGTSIGRTGADGQVGVGPPAGDLIYNVVCRSALADGNTTLVSTFQISYPFVDDQTAAH